MFSSVLNKIVHFLFSWHRKIVLFFFPWEEEYLSESYYKEYFKKQRPVLIFIMIAFLLGGLIYFGNLIYLSRASITVDDKASITVDELQEIVLKETDTYLFKNIMLPSDADDLIKRGDVFVVTSPLGISNKDFSVYRVMGVIKPSDKPPYLLVEHVTVSYDTESPDEYIPVEGGWAYPMYSTSPRRSVRKQFGRLTVVSEQDFSNPHARNSSVAGSWIDVRNYGYVLIPTDMVRYRH